MRSLVPRVFAILLCFSPLGYGSSLLLDFGANPGLVAPADALNSPGHATGAVSSGDITWNLVTSNDIASGLKFGDGSDATGISLHLAVETAIGSNILDFAALNKAASINSGSLTGTTATSLGSDYGTASSAPVAKDGIFRTGSAAAQNAAIGLRIDGLTAGTYTLYFVGRNTNTNANPFAELFYTSVGANADTFNFSSASSVTLGNSNTTGNTSWIAGNQYNSVTVTLGAGDSLFIAAEGASTSAELRGFINSIEIVPEPSAALSVMIGLGALVGMRPTFRRKRA